jgi:NAD(P)-dependent dehydrogenase (short-subunit alcohol dehydrogenase family)
MSELKNSLFIITGAGSGIGQALTLKAITEGANVIAADINEQGLNETIAQANGKAEKYILDVANDEAIISFAADIIKKHPNEKIILVNNAGVGLASGNFTETPLDDFEWLMNINLYGVVRMTKAFLPHFITTKPRPYRQCVQCLWISRHAYQFGVFNCKVWCERFYRCIESGIIRHEH